MTEHEANPIAGGASAELRALATAYELLALSFRHPAPELAGAAASGEWAEAASEVAGALGLDLSDGWDAGLDDYSDREPEALLRALRAEATRLFVGAPEPAVSPYEGVWRAADDGVQALLFVNPHSMAVERFVHGCGLGRPGGTNEPLDHAATELELLQWLCMIECGLVAAPEGAEPPHGSWAAARARFLEDHARTWMPRFAEAAAAESREPLFRAAAVMLGATIS